MVSKLRQTTNRRKTMTNREATSQAKMINAHNPSELASHIIRFKFAKLDERTGDCLAAIADDGAKFTPELIRALEKQRIYL